MMRSRMIKTLLGCFVGVGSICLAAAALAAIPGQVSYQGLLLDSQGDPVTAAVAMEFELFDAANGGTALWYESHPAVQVVDGVYDVVLGATTPITQGLVQGGSLHLEVTVEGETLTPRQQLLMVPYAMRAEVAENAASFGSYEAAYFDSIIEHLQLDGQEPGNTHPDEGVIDSDNDGIANFVDPDNDNDGLADGLEVLQGSHINLVTPTITGFSPPTADGFLATVVQVEGTNFESGMTVAFGSQGPTPTNVTPTAFDVTVGPQAEGTAAVTVTRSNGESASSSFDFFLLVPSISSYSPVEFDETQTGTITVTGQNFYPGMTVQFGSQTPTPSNVTATSFDIALASAEPPGNPLVTVTLPNGKSTNDSGFLVNTAAPRAIFITSTQHGGNLGGIAGADGLCQGLADGAGLGGTYYAWLSDGTTHPSTRNTQRGPYLLTNGTTVADDWADLIDGSIDAQISTDQNTNTVGGLVSVWTNVAAVGAGATGPDDCLDWTSNSNADRGGRGNRSVNSSTWTESLSTIACDQQAYLYCVEQ